MSRNTACHSERSLRSEESLRQSIWISYALLPKHRILILSPLILLFLVFGCGKKVMEPLKMPSPKKERHIASPHIYAKSFWDAELPTGSFRQQTPTTIAVTDDKARVASSDEAFARIKQLQHRAIKEGWGDLPYHFYIDPKGNIFSGRTPEQQSPAVRPNLDLSGEIVICFLNDFKRYPPSDEELSALMRLAAWLCDNHSIPVSSVRSLKDRDPELAPGKLLQAYFDQNLIAPRVQDFLKQAKGGK